MKIASLLFVIGILLVMGCGMNRPTDYKPPANQTNGTGEDVLVGCGAIADANLRDNCYLKEVIEQNGGVAICGKITNVRIADRCTRFAAERDRSLCDKIDGTDLREDCYLYWAKRNNDSAECARILTKSTQEACHALFEAPKGACEKINGTLDKTVCLANLTGNYSMCSDYSPEGYNATMCLAQTDASKAACLDSRDICYFELAASLSNEAICAGIGYESIRTACKAVVSGTHGLCGSLEFVASRDLCYDKVAYETQDDGICGFIETDDYKNDCYQSLALAKEDVTLCSMKVKDWDKDACYGVFARKYGDITACSVIGGPDTRDACMVDVARIVGEPYLCSNIKNDYNRNYNCFLPIVTSGNYEMTREKCGRITDIYVQWADQCYLEVWKKTGDASVCAKIVTTATRNMCG